MPKEHKNTARCLKDHGPNYNAFSYNPDGWVAYLVALFYGPDWVSWVTPKQFGGPPAPPHFGPPAPYQEACLPPGFKPRMHPDFYKLEAAFMASENVALGEESDFLDSLQEFDPEIFDAFKFGRDFMQSELLYKW